MELDEGRDVGSLSANVGTTQAPHSRCRSPSLTDDMVITSMFRMKPVVLSAPAPAPFRGGGRGERGELIQHSTVQHKISCGPSPCSRALDT